MEILSKNSKDLSSVSIKNKTKHMATLPTGVIGSMEKPITIVKPSHDRFTKLNALIRSVVHTYHPELSETFIVHYWDVKEMNNFFEVNNIDLLKNPILNNTVCNVHQSQKLAQQLFSLYQTLKKKYNFGRSFIFFTPILMIMNISNF